jgi:hypothetical protein
MEVTGKGIKQYPSNPNEHKYMHIGEIERSEVSLDEAVRKIE